MRHPILKPLPPQSFQLRATVQVLVYCFRTVMALLHPLMPFVTERLWQALPHQGAALIAAPWPPEHAHVDAQSLRHFEVRTGSCSCGRLGWAMSSVSLECC